MMKGLALLALFFGTVNSSSSSETGAPLTYGGMTFVAGVPVYNHNVRAQGFESDWLLSLNANTSSTQVRELCSNLPGHANCTFQGHPSEGGMPMVNLRASDSEFEECLKTYRHIIAFAEPDGEWAAIPDVPEEPSNASMTASSTPWGLDRIDARFGLDGAYKSNKSGGQGVHVYVLDTGIRTTHVDFRTSDGSSRAIPTLEVQGKGVIVCNTSDTSCAADGNGHGTHCAGTIGGASYGVAKGALVHAVKVLSDKGSGQWSWFIAALDWVAAHGQRPAIVSASLGGGGQSASVEKAVNAAVAAGVTVVVAAGNNYGDACTKSPAFVPAAITVGATDRNDKRADFSNYGKCLDIFAPGVKIASAGQGSDTATKTLSGTSMACPHVSGAAALLLEQDDKLSAQEVAHQLRTRATGYAVQNAMRHSPNLLLYVGEDPPRTWTSTTTTRAPLAPASGFCGFENSAQPFCGIWHQSPHDEFDWTQRSGSTPSSNTGPNKAHGGKNYVYTEASSPRQKGDEAIMEALTPTLKSGGFLSFFYHMKGSTMGTLKVKVQSTKTGATQELWSQSKSQGDQWKFQMLSLDSFSGEAVLISFVGIRGSSWSGDIAIDDVMLSTEPWTGTTTTTTTVTTTTATTTTGSQFVMQIREVGGQGCLKSQGGNKLLQSNATSGCATFLVQGQRFKSVEVSGQCLDYFANRGWGLYNCHGGANQKLQQQNSKWCFKGYCIEAAILVTTTLPTSSTSSDTSSTTTRATTAPPTTTTTTTPTPPTTTITTTATTTTTIATTTATTSTVMTTTSTMSIATTATISSSTSTTISATAVPSTTTTTTTSTISEKSIESGDTIFLKTRSGNGNHMDVEGVSVRARWQSQGNLQAITIEKKGGGAVHSDDVVYLRAHTAAHIDVENEVVSARWSDTGSWQAMKIQKRTGSGAILPGDIVCLLSVHTSKHLDAEDDVIRARWNDCGDWQAMKIEREVVGALSSGDSIHLLAHTGKRIDVDLSGSVHARWSEAGTWQTFTLENYGGRTISSGDTVFLKAHTGKLVHVEDTAVFAKWDDYGNWQKFTIHKKNGENGPVMPGDVIFLRAHTGKLVHVEDTAVFAKWDDYGNWQSLTVEKSASQSASRRLTAASQSNAMIKPDKEQEERANILLI